MTSSSWIRPRPSVSSASTGQPKSYEIRLQKLADTLGYPRELRHLAAAVRDTMRRLEDLGWINGWEIAGNGRRIPQKLIVQRR